ncbi:hypothetical protein GQ600_3401 [Phytophthora cactorum]|nr:hypothetical protein GQ600_3401 [Phytophthora cactorum]
MEQYLVKLFLPLATCDWLVSSHHRGLETIAFVERNYQILVKTSLLTSPDNDSGENCNRSDAFSQLGTDEEAITDDPYSTASERDAAFGQGAVQAAVNIDSDTDVEFHDADVALPYKSAYALRMLWEGMPRDGWIVDPASKPCQCRFNTKFAMCLHVIEAAKILGVPCPGMPKPKRGFVNRSQRNSSRKRTHRRMKRQQTQGDSRNIANKDFIYSGVAHFGSAVV